MSENLEPQIGTIKLSQIIYQSDLTQLSARVIPLGAIGELTIGPVRAMGMIARTSLAPQELELVANLLRIPLSAPFDLLKGEFDWAWKEQAAGEGVLALAAKHTESLQFSTPRFHSFPCLEMPAAAMAQFGLAELRRERDAEFLKLLLERWKSRDVPEQEELGRLAA
jgi:hypothetical protein